MDDSYFDLNFNDLRKIFGFILAQNGISTVVIQRLFEHSLTDLTNKVYTNVDPDLTSSYRHYASR